MSLSERKLKIKLNGPVLIRAFFAICLLLTVTVVYSATDTPDELVDSIEALDTNDPLVHVSELVVINWLIDREDKHIQQRLNPLRNSLRRRIAREDNVFQKFKISPLAAAAFIGQKKIVIYMIENGESINPTSHESDVTPLQMAILRGNWSGVFLLLERGADPGMVGKSGATLVYQMVGRIAWFLNTCKKKNSSWTEEKKQRVTAYYRSLIKLFIDKGCNPNIAPNFDNSPLVLAAKNGLLQTVQLLIDCGVNLNTKDRVGQTALIAAIKNQHQDVAELLLQYGAPPNMRNNRGQFPLLMAVKTHNPDLVEILLESGADVHLSWNASPLLAIAIQWHADEDILIPLLNAGAPLVKKEDNEDALHAAVLFHQEDKLPLLFARGGDLHGRYNITRLNLIHVAVRADNPDAINRLITLGLDINGQDRLGATPLYFAVANRRYRCLNRLIQLGADPTRKNKKGKTPLDLAIKKRDKTAIGMLRVAIDKWKEKQTYRRAHDKRKS